jgi:Ca2+-binding RTX toxin-like protein
MYGDGYELLGFAVGGGNTLIVAGSGLKDLWGGAAIVSPTAQIGPNTFEFLPVSNPTFSTDTIMDFRSGEDHIDLQGFGISSFQQLEQDFHPTASGLDIVFGPNNDILLHGVSQVVAGDFVFT